jgi:hypothetical protein
MGRNITEATKGSSKRARNVAGVAEAARSTSTAAPQTNAAALEWARVAGDVQVAIQQFRLQESGAASGNQLAQADKPRATGKGMHNHPRPTLRAFTKVRGTPQGVPV